MLELGDTSIGAAVILSDSFEVGHLQQSFLLVQ